MRMVITYWGAPTVPTSAREQRESRACRGLFRRACTLINKLRRDRKSITSHRPLSLLTNTKPWGLLLCPAKKSQRSHTRLPRIKYNGRMALQILEHVNKSPRCDYGIWYRDILLNTLYYFVALPVPFPCFITMWVHTKTKTQLAEGGKECAGVVCSIMIIDDEINLSLLLLAVVVKSRNSGRRQDADMRDVSAPIQFNTKETKHHKLPTQMCVLSSTTRTEMEGWFQTWL